MSQGKLVDGNTNKDVGPVAFEVDSFPAVGQVLIDYSNLIITASRTMMLQLPLLLLLERHDIRLLIDKYSSHPLLQRYYYYYYYYYPHRWQPPHGRCQKTSQPANTTSRHIHLPSVVYSTPIPSLW